jgi:hypothetical protein
MSKLCTGCEQLLTQQMTKTLTIAALALIALATEASAQQYVSSDTLHRWCQQQPAAAMDYVAGAMDALMLSNGPRMCVPEGSTLGQARDVVCNETTRRRVTTTQLLM